MQRFVDRWKRKMHIPESILGPINKKNLDRDSSTFVGDFEIINVGDISTRFCQSINALRFILLSLQIVFCHPSFVSKLGMFAHPLSPMGVYVIWGLREEDRECHVTLTPYNGSIQILNPSQEAIAPLKICKQTTFDGRKQIICSYSNE